MKIWTCGNSPRSGSRNAWTRIKNVNSVSRVSKFWNFFVVIQMNSCRDWWPWKKPVYITMTRRQQQSIEWRHSGLPHPKKFRVQKSTGKVLPSIFWDQDGILLIGHWLSSKGPNYQRRVLLISAGAIEGHFEEKTAAGRSPRGSCSCTTMPRLTEHLLPTGNWPTWASNVLITHPIHRIWPRRTTVPRTK